MRRPLEFLSTVVVAALMLGSCGGAQPEPTSEAGATGGQVQSLGTQRDIIPLDEVKKSQHGTLTQTVANTEISIVYKPAGLHGDGSCLARSCRTVRSGIRGRMMPRRSSSAGTCS